MTQYGHDGPIEQILFGLAFPGGIGARRWSPRLSDKQVDDWCARLGKYNRLSPTFISHKPWVPTRAFSYFEFPDRTAALLARFKTEESGRNSSHALVGPASTLGHYAMFLSEWDGWCAEDPGHTLSSVSQDDWHHILTRWTDTALLRANENRAALTTLAREVLLSDETHFTLLVRTDPLPLLTLLRGVLDPVLSTPDSEFAWTYSTYETSDTDPEASPDEDGAPRFWCVRCLPTSGHTGRHRVVVDQAIEDDPYAELAVELVAAYLKDPSQYPATITGRLSGVHGRGPRVATLLQNRWHVQPATTPGRRSAAPGVPATAIQPDPIDRGRQASAAPVRHPQAGSSEVLPSTSTPHGSSARPAGRRSSRTTHDRPRRRSYRPPDASELFTSLSERELTREQRRTLVADLRNLWEAEDPYHVSVRRTMNRVEQRLKWHDGVLMVTIVVLVLVAILAWATAHP